MQAGFDQSGLQMGGDRLSTFRARTPDRRGAGLWRPGPDPRATLANGFMGKCAYRTID